MALQPMLECMTDGISESVTNRHRQKFNFQRCEMDVREKKEKKKKKIDGESERKRKCRKGKFK